MYWLAALLSLSFSGADLSTRAVRIRELGGSFQTCIPCRLKNLGSVTLRGDHFELGGKGRPTKPIDAAIITMPTSPVQPAK
jgi:hypothetical protein